MDRGNSKTHCYKHWPTVNDWKTCRLPLSTGSLDLKKGVSQRFYKYLDLVSIYSFPNPIPRSKLGQRGEEEIINFSLNCTTTGRNSFRSNCCRITESLLAISSLSTIALSISRKELFHQHCQFAQE